MHDADTPNKTAADRAEVTARKLHLNPRQRTVLIAVNGQQSMQQIRNQFRVLGDVDAIIGSARNARPRKPRQPLRQRSPRPPWHRMVHKCRRSGLCVSS